MIRRICSRRASSMHHSIELAADALAAVRLVDRQRADLGQVGPDDRQRGAADDLPVARS